MIDFRSVTFGVIVYSPCAVMVVNQIMEAKQCEKQTESSVRDLSLNHLRHPQLLLWLHLLSQNLAFLPHSLYSFQLLPPSFVICFLYLSLFQVSIFPHYYHRMNCLMTFQMNETNTIYTCSCYSAVCRRRASKRCFISTAICP